MPWPTTSRHERGYGGAWDKLRLRILERDGYLCQMCKAEGRVNEAKVVDHRTPKAKGGTDDMANLWSLCKRHDDAKQLTDAGKVKRAAVGLDGWPREK